MGIKNHENNILKGYNMLLYFAGSMIMHEPSEECVVDFWRNGILKRLPVSSSNPNFVLAASQLRESCTDKNICGRLIREDYLRLFAREDLSLAPVYESLYSNKGSGDSSEKNHSVTEFYNSYGWVSKFKGKINDDHLGVELLFLTLLIDKLIVIDDKFCQIEMRNEISRFISDHILSWIPAWNRLLQVNAKTICFKGIGTLILACTEDIFSMMLRQKLSGLAAEQFKN